MAHPESVFSNTLTTTLYGNHPRLALVAKPDDFTHIDAARASTLFYNRFSSAKGFTFVIVGSFKLAEIKPLIETYLASLPVADIDLKYRDLNIRPVKGIVIVPGTAMLRRATSALANDSPATSIGP